MLTDAYESLKTLEAKLEELAAKPLEEFQVELVGLLKQASAPKKLSELRALKAKFDKRKAEMTTLTQQATVQTEGIIADRLEAEREDLAELERQVMTLEREFLASEERRVFKKLSTYLVERLADVVLRLRLEDEESRMHLLDQAEVYIKSASDLTEEPEVEDSTRIESYLLPKDKKVRPKLVISE